MSNLDTITKKLGKHHRDEATSKKALERERQKFFDEASKEAAKGTLAQKVVVIPTEESAEDWVSSRHPGWLLVKVYPDERQALLQEDPKLLKFAYVNHKDGMMYQRNITEAAPSLDDEKLQRDHPDLWKRITVPTRELKPVKEIGQDDLEIFREYLIPGKLTEKLEKPRKAKPEELSSE